MSDDLTLEKLRIVQKLGEVSERLTRIDGKFNLFEESMKNDRRKLNELGEDIWGNGKPGLKMNMDRMIQREKLRNWVMGSLTLVLMGVVGRITYDLLKAIGG